MPNLCLSVATENLVAANKRDPLLTLFVRAEGVDRSVEHRVAEANTRQKTLEVVSEHWVGILDHLPIVEGVGHVVVDVQYSAPQICLLLISVHVVEAVMVRQSRVLRKPLTLSNLGI